MAGEKRSQDQDETARTVLIDIEGTTTSISFVKTDIPRAATPTTAMAMAMPMAMAMAVVRAIPTHRPDVCGKASIYTVEFHGGLLSSRLGGVPARVFGKSPPPPPSPSCFETLFPYVRQNLKDYIETKWEDEEFKQDYEKLKEQAKKDENDKLDGFVAIIGDKPEEEKDSLLKNVLWQMDSDRKTGALKQLQGHMWREAYKTGAIKAHVYEDVPKALESWKNDGRKIYVYSSGSVEAQKLLFGHSIHGDLLKYFSGFFDTEVGAKQESDSYKNILSKIDDQPSNVVFLTDVVKEAAAAKEAGLSTVIVVREGNAALNDEEKIMYTTIKSFLDLTFQTSTKRQKLETTNEKIDKDTTDVSEPMDTSEDVEVPDINDPNIKKNEDVKKETESEGTECLKNQMSQDTSISSPQKEEPMAIEKDPSNSEQKTPIAEAEESVVKPKDMNEDTNNSSGNAEETVKDDTTLLTTKKSDQIVIPEKTEENLDTVTTEIVPTANKSLDVSISESISKSENTPTSSEEKIKDSTDIAKDIKVESVDKTQVADNDKKDDIEPQSQNCDNTTADKLKECLTAEKDEKEEKESKIVSGKSENENVTKNEQEEIKNVEPIAVDLAENGETTQAAVENITVTEMEATTSTTDVKKEVTTPADVSAEKSLETVAKTEKIDEKTSQETEETMVTDAEKRENETTKQETKDEETVKEENVVDTKDKNIVDSEKQKLNGTAQNGNTDVPVLDDKLHSNGLNEGPSKETTSEEAAAQNGEPESSSESSAESIKVKKVVDSTVVEGAGEPDVVPPVVVAATS
ncbi:Enolase-phosphatase E1 [Camponotus floridanus]|uniref:Enolase-phosphatase E1 n=1 Tax=Camponotus floridanus TaxID=104421 RepID=E2AG58_CAMFO|nr:Enolase-phosphatase E1 [Camponotus floridanus]